VFISSHSFVNKYRLISLSAALVFGVVGIIILLSPERVIAVFNQLSPMLHLPISPVEPGVFLRALAAAYMYVVTLIALMMFINPRVVLLPKLLAHAKLASAGISLYLFVFGEPYLILLTNFVVDGIIGLTAVYLYVKMRRFS